MLDVSDEFDVFLLDAFGVLNVGGTAIAGAPETVKALSDEGKDVMVLTNGATIPAADALAKYRAWGYDFTPAQVVASRDLLAGALAGYPPDWTWGFVAPTCAQIAEFPVRSVRLDDEEAPFDEVDAFVFLSTDTGAWSDAQQASLCRSMSIRPRTVLVGNPDVAAPNESGFSLEPGYFAHELAEIAGVSAHFFGKPFANAFEHALDRLPRAVDPSRVAMVGDSLHTDILGGAAAGFRTVVVTGHGLFSGGAATPHIAASGIVPDFIVETTSI